MHQASLSSIDRGFTLVEALICLAIAAILLGTATPAVTNMIKHNEAARAINWAVISVNFARHSALTFGTMVTLCPSKDGAACKGKWHEGTIVFTDTNMDRKVNGTDVLLKRFEFPVEGASLEWRAFQNKQYLQMTRHGFTNYQNGNFTYCPRDGDARFARQLIINIQGRARTAKDMDGDGIVEDTRGKNLTCDKQ